MVSEAGFEIDSSRAVQIGLTPWFDKFFSTFSTTSQAALFRVIGGMHASVESMVELRDFREGGLSGWSYWFLYLKGYIQYRDSDELLEDNIYCQYLSAHMTRLGHDAGLTKSLGDPTMLRDRVRWRYHDVDAFLRVHDLTGALDDVAPITLVVRNPPGHGAAKVFLAHQKEPVQVSRLDGYHRLFLARLSGLEALPCTIIREADHLPVLQGGIGWLRYSAGRLLLSGRLRICGRSINGFELRLANTTLSWIPHEANLEDQVGACEVDDCQVQFNFDVALQRQVGVQPTLEVVPTMNFRPLGRFEVPLEPVP